MFSFSCNTLNLWIGVLLMDLETVKLATIVERLAPEMFECLTSQELETKIVLRDGIEVLEPEDAMEIVQFSICRGQTGTILH